VLGDLAFIFSELPAEEVVQRGADRSDGGQLSELAGTRSDGGTDDVAGWLALQDHGEEADEGEPHGHEGAAVPPAQTDPHEPQEAHTASTTLTAVPHASTIVIIRLTASRSGFCVRSAYPFPTPDHALARGGLRPPGKQTTHSDPRACFAGR